MVRRIRSGNARGYTLIELIIVIAIISILIAVAVLAASVVARYATVNARADVIALCGAGKLTIVEIKSSVADFRADRKWPDYRDFCDRFFFAKSNARRFGSYRNPRNNGCVN